jgi:NADPH:quinone reductase
MQAVLCESWRPFDALTLAEVPPPAMRPGAVRIKIAAAAVSFATALVVSGRYQRKPPLPFIPGTEIAGTITEIAPDVQGLQVGMRIFAVLDWGGLAQEAVADAIHVVPLPDGLDLAAATALPISYATAAAALWWRGRMQAGQWVLVHGAGGGVGLAAVELAVAAGAQVIARAGAAKHAVLRDRGAAAVLDSSEPFLPAVRALVGGGVDLVVDPLGGDAFPDSLRCLVEGGTLLTVGYASGAIPQVGANILLLKNIAVAGLNWGTYVGWSPGDGREAYAGRVRAVWDELVALWQRGQIRPVVHAAMKLREFRAAMAEVQDRRAIGRVVLLPQGN